MAWLVCIYIHLKKLQSILWGRCSPQFVGDAQDNSGFNSVWWVISATSRLTFQGGSHRSYLDGRQWTLLTLSIKGQHDWSFSAHVRLPSIKCNSQMLAALKGPLPEISSVHLKFYKNNLLDTTTVGVSLSCEATAGARKTKLKVMEFKWVLNFQRFKSNIVTVTQT